MTKQLFLAMVTDTLSWDDPRDKASDKKTADGIRQYDPQLADMIDTRDKLNYCIAEYCRAKLEK